MANNRVFYAIEQVAMKRNSAPATQAVAPINAVHYASGTLAPIGRNEVNDRWEVPRGVQSVGMSTTFNLEQVFQLGQVELYEYSERQPDVEMTLEKVLDGTKPMWFMVTDPSGLDLVSRTSSWRTDVMLSIYPDTQFRANQNTPQAAVLASGMYLSSVTYTFPVDGPVTESITLIGNDKIWDLFVPVSGQVVSVYPNTSHGVGIPSGVFGHEDDSNKSELAGGTGSAGVIVVGSGVQRREEVDMGRSVLPNDIPGITAFVASGISAEILAGAGASGVTATVGTSNTSYLAERVQNITITADIGRDDIFELGQKRPYFRAVSFPVEITTSIEVITAQGDLIDATSNVNCGPDNTASSNTVIIRTCDGTQIDVGDTNRIVSVELGGGSTGGENMTVTYNYSTFNTLYVTHDRFDPRHRVYVNRDPNSRFVHVL